MDNQPSLHKCKINSCYHETYCHRQERRKSLIQIKDRKTESRSCFVTNKNKTGLTLNVPTFTQVTVKLLSSRFCTGTCVK